MKSTNLPTHLAHYTTDKNAQIVLALLKAHNIRKIIVSPGTTNITIARSAQNDSFFTLYSAIDERSAAYMACGLSEESGEAVVLSCTDATAARNYMSALTEAYYRKLPILAITSTQNIDKVGHLIPQVTDRSHPPRDIVRHSVYLGIPKNDDEAWACEVKANTAILELFRAGGGSVHINLETSYSADFSVRELPKVRVIKRITQGDFGFLNPTHSALPQIPQSNQNGQKAKNGILLGSHSAMSERLTKAIDEFCAKYDAVVFCDHTSGYYGNYRVAHSISTMQRQGYADSLFPDLVIYMGEVSAYSYVYGKSVWRVSEYGQIRDTFRNTEYVFEMPEIAFFEYYNTLEDSVANTVGGGKCSDSFRSLDSTSKSALNLNSNTSRFTDSNSTKSYIEICKERLQNLWDNVPELPFSNIYLAHKSHHLLPKDCVVHLGILHSIRSWNFFDFPKSVRAYSNVGGFGIDGCVSAALGASLADTNRLVFCIVGDLAFFYDLNALGNRHLGANLRILLINNGKGTEFRNVGHLGALFGESSDEFTAAAGHFGNKSPTLVRDFVRNLGFIYLSANDKESYEKAQKEFFCAEITQKPMLLEVFTNDSDESKALEIITNMEITTKSKQKARKNKPKISLGKKIKRETLRVVKQIERKLED